MQQRNQICDNRVKQLNTPWIRCGRPVSTTYFQVSGCRV